MPRLVQQIAELLADFFTALMRPQKHGKWQFHRGKEIVIVTVEVLTNDAIEEYETAMVGWKMPEDAVVVS